MAPTQAPVLITGETGTGKELVARAIHQQSLREDCSFVPFNCGGVPAELLENELFGHEPGAFTSAQRKQVGLLTRAEGGTLFLDEIDSLPLSAQAALLRFLQDHEYRPLGAGSLSKADVRILAASNADLPKRVRENRFREDLWFRLSVLIVKLPPLRDRKEDIPVLAELFLRRFAEMYGSPLSEFRTDTLQQMMDYSWPGNVRELENWVHRTVILGEEWPFFSSVLESADSFTEKNYQRRKIEMLDAFEKDLLTNLLVEAHGNVTKAARIAGKERRCFGKLLKKHGIDASAFKPS